MSNHTEEQHAHQCVHDHGHNHQHPPDEDEHEHEHVQGERDQPGHLHDHQHQHQHQCHGHDHGQGHSHEHGHTHGQGDDLWSGRDYMSMPGVKETAVISTETVIYALTSAGLTKEDVAKLDLLEIGCGPGAVTTNLLHHFSTIHAIDTSPSMLTSFSTHHPPSSNPKLTYSLHSLSSSSPKAFDSREPMLSPTVDDPERKIVPPRNRFDVAVANLVLHHVDDVKSFMEGVVGLLKSGGWIVFTEFGRDESEGYNNDAKTLPDGSVNAPNHFHPAYTTETLSTVLTDAGLDDVHAEVKGRLPVFGVDKPYQPPGLVVRGRKP
ncbi:hypothetical protein CI109_105328 [Kwoniella shandongensis]|uniref:Uncharacterized protein n=1 Tax=Kwoniella shandongensis TaxID=1734106 RepID=A0A5M6BUT4_9TREE|nr:uncharacterized protein CI109_005014 [Kwoniella shandongensis]KAA5526624.1 hypothetical protein CI109_005014 [Kwoniella shandongensis]